MNRNETNYMINHNPHILNVYTYKISNVIDHICYHQIHCKPIAMGTNHRQGPVSCTHLICSLYHMIVNKHLLTKLFSLIISSILTVLLHKIYFTVLSLTVMWPVMIVVSCPITYIPAILMINHTTAL